MTADTPPPRRNRQLSNARFYTLVALAAFIAFLTFVTIVTLATGAPN